MRHLPRFEIFKDTAGEWRFRLISQNGRILCQSEGYTRRTRAREGVNALCVAAAKAKTIVIPR